MCLSLSHSKMDDSDNSEFESMMYHFFNFVPDIESGKI